MPSKFQPGTLWVSNSAWDLASRGQPHIMKGDLFMVLHLIEDNSDHEPELGVRSRPDYLRVLCPSGRSREIVVWEDDVLPCNEQPAVV